MKSLKNFWRSKISEHLRVLNIHLNIFLHYWTHMHCAIGSQRKEWHDSSIFVMSMWLEVHSNDNWQRHHLMKSVPLRRLAICMKLTRTHLRQMRPKHVQAVSRTSWCCQSVPVESQFQMKRWQPTRMLYSARRLVAKQNRSAHLSFAVAAFLTDSTSIHSTISIVLDYSTLLTRVSRAVEVGSVVSCGTGSFGPVMWFPYIEYYSHTS